MALVYTPQVVLQGRDFRGWGTPAFDAAVAKIAAQPAKARISLLVRQGAPRALEVEAGAELLDPAQQADAALYLAAYENRLSSTVTAGREPRAHARPRLRRPGVAGPVCVRAAARVLERRQLALLPRAAASSSGVVGFVQNRRTAEVLQALMLPACPG